MNAEPTEFTDRLDVGYGTKRGIEETKWLQARESRRINGVAFIKKGNTIGRPE